MIKSRLALACLVLVTHAARAADAPSVPARLILAERLSWGLQGDEPAIPGGDPAAALAVPINAPLPPAAAQAIAAQKPLHGCDKIARFLVAIRRSKVLPKIIPKIVQINDCLGILNTFEGKPQSTFSFEFSGDRIQSIFAVVNPDKLKQQIK